jgi:hypothetical protein
LNTYCQSPYLESILEPDRLKIVIDSLVKVIRNKIGLGGFDAIAYRGMSGAGVATTLGYILNKPLIMVRKSTTNCHSRHTVEGLIKSKRIIVVDDCIFSGETVATTVKNILEERQKVNYLDEFEVVSVVLYNDPNTRYHLLKGEETLEDSFKTIFSYSICNNGKFKDTLEAMRHVKVYSFCVGKPDFTDFKITVGTNVDIDDFK